MPTRIAEGQVQEVECPDEGALEPVTALLLGTDRSADLAAHIAEWLEQCPGVPTLGCQSRMAVQPRTNRSMTAAISSCSWIAHRASAFVQPEHVSDTPDGLEVSGVGGILLDVAPEPVHVDVDGPGLAGIVIAPDALEELVAREDLARVA
jgi:hypothetical protein